METGGNFLKYFLNLKYFLYYSGQAVVMSTRFLLMDQKIWKIPSTREATCPAVAGTGNNDNDNDDDNNNDNVGISHEYLVTRRRTTTSSTETTAVTEPTENYRVPFSYLTPP